MSPKVSVLMSVLNGEAFLRQAIDSILRQSFADFEFIIIDNASTDRTADILNSYSDHRIVLLQNTRTVSLTEALNRGLAAARGLYIARLDADDVAAPTRLERQVAVLVADEQIVLAGSHVLIINARGEVTGRLSPPTNHNELYECLAYSNPFAHSAVIFRRDVAGDGYPTRFVYGQDFAMWIKLAQQGKLAMLGEALVSLRMHDGQTSRSKKYLTIRANEIGKLYRLSLKSLNFSAPIRVQAWESLSKFHYFSGVELWHSGSLLPACKHFLLCVLASPALCARGVTFRVRLAMQRLNPFRFRRRR